jgi:hypothetical protein
VSAVKIRQKEIESKQLERFLLRDIEHEAERKRASRNVTGQESSRGFLSDYYILELGLEVQDKVPAEREFVTFLSKDVCDIHISIEIEARERERDQVRVFMSDCV